MQGLEGHLQQLVGAFGNHVAAADEGVERLVAVGEFTTPGPLDRAAEGGPRLLVPDVRSAEDLSWEAVRDYEFGAYQKIPFWPSLARVSNRIPPSRK
ncbi:hypothetical protein GCM10010211_33990 [Streptomyces albospinus]|uniref:Uncharacterized protein n=1 Tax=Streptomyces albospinus TaxID=285515 RepID=A0ABQ2V3D7_9ACTN|nr:hypothetical protein GCM10010211_33990 [Streptomyces albospinus]